MSCVRCGECCKHIPCYFAQLRYHITKKGETCPALIFDGAPFTCMWQLEDKEFRDYMNSGECDYPEWQKLPSVYQALIGGEK